MKKYLLTGLAAGAAVLLFPDSVSADNCSAFFDCFDTAAAAAAAAAAAGILAAIISTALDFTPGVGTVKGVIEGAVGYDMTGEKLSPWDRAMGVVPMGRGISKALKLAGKMAKTAKNVQRLEKAAKGIDRALDLKDKYDDIRKPYDDAKKIYDTADKVAQHARDYLQKVSPPSPSQNARPLSGPSTAPAALPGSLAVKDVASALRLGLKSVKDDAPKSVLVQTIKNLVKGEGKNSQTLAVLQKMAARLDKLPKETSAKEALSDLSGS